MVGVPGILPTPMKHLGENQQSLHGAKEIFDITAVTVAAMASIISGIAATQSVVTAGTLDKLSGEVASALSSQNNINCLVQLGALNLKKLFSSGDSPF